VWRLAQANSFVTGLNRSAALSIRRFSKRKANDMTSIGIFPFGQPVREVVQTDRTQKRVFVLGVYASAVHARWVGKDNEIKVKALAIASEPYIFWRGDNAEAIIQQITVPPKLGKLVPADKQFNGPSGIALDELILQPLGLSREEAWCCDLVPHSCVNQGQSKSIEREYRRDAKKYGLPMAMVLPVPTALTDEKRRSAICDELQESGANTLILLGDKPIQWFLSYFDNHQKNLSDFGHDSQSYGRLHNAHIGSQEIKVLPLAHPRQIAKLGRGSTIWYKLHQTWNNEYAGKVFHS
jgi:hypothetical protein